MGHPRGSQVSCANRDRRAVRCSKPHAQRGQSKTHLQHSDLTQPRSCRSSTDCTTSGQRLHHNSALILARPATQRRCAAPRNAEACRKKAAGYDDLYRGPRTECEAQERIFISKTLGCDLHVRMRVTWSQIGAWSLRVGERSAEAGARKVRTERHPAFITEPPRRISSACGLFHHPLPHGVIGSNWYGMMV